MDATIGALRGMGANIIRKGKHVTVHGIEKPREKALIDCIESGSTVRFMIPVALTVAGGGIFTAGIPAVFFLCGTLVFPNLNISFLHSVAQAATF